MKFTFTLLASIFILLLAACNNANTQPNTSNAPSLPSATGVVPGAIKEETVTITADTTHMQCFVAYDGASTQKRPIVLVLPEWWGLNDYPKSRARQLAQLGYFAVAVDIFGNGKIAANPDEAKAFSGAFYGNPQLAAGRILAALAKAKTYQQADSNKTAAIGYCFGGSMVLNTAKLGAPLDGVVSFHGGLAGVPPSKNTLKAKILVCHGMADKFVPAQDVATFKKQLDSVGATYTFKQYPDATHAFTNPNATETGKKFNMPIAYNAEADKNSWNDMKAFFALLWK